MPIIDIQRQLVELGRIRTGDQVEFTDQGGKTRLRPRKLETFRLTSPSRPLVEAAAAAYGGMVEPWGEQWQVVVTAESLPIMLPPGQALSQWYEQWSGGGCQRRCDGARQVLVDEPCACPLDKAERAQLASKGDACKPTTRVNLILPELPGLGVWRLESHGYYAAVELAGAAEYLSMATAAGHRIPARLRLVQRQMKRQAIGRDGKPTVQTRRFAVPTIDLDVRIADLLAGDVLNEGPAAPPSLPAGPVNRRERVERPALPAGPALPEEANLSRPGRAPFPEPVEIESAGSDPASEPTPAETGEIAIDIAGEPAVRDLGDGRQADVGTGEVTGSEPNLFGAVVPPTLGERLIGDAGASKLSGPASEEQRQGLREALAGTGTASVQAVTNALWGYTNLPAITAAQAQAILDAVAALGLEAFRDQWLDISEKAEASA